MRGWSRATLRAPDTFGDHLSALQTEGFRVLEGVRDGRGDGHEISTRRAVSL
jgi:hypothetical protein